MHLITVFIFLLAMYYRGASAAVIVYDMTDTESFEVTKAWVGELKTYGPPDIVIAVVANKADLASKRVSLSLLLCHVLNTYTNQHTSYVLNVYSSRQLIDRQGRLMLKG